MPDPTLDLLKAQDLAAWKDHAGWEMVLEPEIRKHRDLLTKLLVEISLGKQVQGVTLEQVAGKVYGIDWLLKEIESIAARGASASRILGS